MDPFKMVVFIVLIVSIAGVLKSYLDRGGKGASIMEELGLSDSWGEDPSEVGAHIRKIDELEKRVQVLERIVTSKNYDLKREIDGLADS
ncbi:MAG: hypothetical protein HKN59_02580 [Gammaproteobacteria bacterium]|nr:hypothetical protein [Gammaproteobacteria bacterium]